MEWERLKKQQRRKGQNKHFSLKSSNRQLTAHSILKPFIFFIIWVFKKNQLYVVTCSELRFYKDHFLIFTTQAIKMKSLSNYRMATPCILGKYFLHWIKKEKLSKV